MAEGGIAMKAEEAYNLMIGNWVNLKEFHDEPTWKGLAQVTEIAEDCVSLNLKDDVEDFPGSVAFHAIEPVSLTPEILEKNGFKKLFDGWECGYREEDEGQIFEILWRCDYPNCTHLTITNHQANYGSFKSFNINYVHELQNAIKLCGINKEIIL